MGIFKKAFKSLLVLGLVSGFLFVPGSVQSGSGMMHSYPLTSFIQTRNTNSTLDINALSWQDVPVTGTTDFSTDDFTVVGDEIQVNFTGWVKAYTNIYMNSAIARVSVAIRFKKNNVLMNGKSSHAYIRFSTGHNESNANLTEFIQVTKGDLIKVCSYKEAATGVVTMQVDRSVFILERVR